MKEERIITKDKMTLVGLAIDVTLKNVEEDRATYKLAYTFLNRKHEIRSCKNEKIIYGLSTDPVDYNPESSDFEFFVGMEVLSVDDIPEGMIIRTVPANTYIQFTFEGTADKAGAIHGYLYSTWLKNNDYELCDRYNIEIYDERNHGPESPESVTDLCFPIRKKTL